MNILTIIFSKDRAMQLDATLHSFYSHCKDETKPKIKIIYRVSDDIHRQQYQQLVLDYAKKDIDFFEEHDFSRELLAGLWNEYHLRLSRWKRMWSSFLKINTMLLKSPISVPLPSTDQFVLFLVDDNIFVRDFYLEDYTKTLAMHKDCIGFSLRLGMNTTYCYPLQASQQLPDFEQLGDGVLKFNWTVADKDFRYPLEVSSSIYRLSEMIDLIIRLKYKNPNQLEGAMAAHTHLFSIKQPGLCCTKQSITFCNPINVVQKVYPNLSGNQEEYSSENLSTLFEQGYRIDIDAFSGFTPNGCHQVEAINFIN